MKTNKKNPRDLQAIFRKQFVQQTPGRVLVVGSKVYPGRPDWRLTHPDGVGVDMEDGPGVNVVANLERGPLRGEKFAHIECVSVLEHSTKPWVLAANLEKMLLPGGSIFISAPWVWRYHGYPQDLWRFSHHALPVLFPSITWTTVRYRCGDELTESERTPKNDSGLLSRMEVLATGIKPAPVAEPDLCES